MKFILLVLVFAFGLSANPISSDCMFRGKKMFGLVRVVQIGANFKVRIINFADLRVEPIQYKPFRCGQWRFVQAGEDFTIEFVQAGEDFTI